MWWVTGRYLFVLTFYIIILCSNIKFFSMGISPLSPLLPYAPDNGCIIHSKVNSWNKDKFLLY